MSTSPARRQKRKLADKTTIPADASKPQAAAAARSGVAQPEIGYVVKCSRSSELLDFDEELFVDLNDDEEDTWRREAEDNAVAADGSWIWDADPARATGFFGPTGKGSFAGGGGKPIFFRDLLATDTAASGVWIALLLGVRRPSRPVLQQLEDQALGPQKKRKSSANGLRSKESQEAAAAAEAVAALDAGLAAGDVAACQQLLSYFGQVSADGLAAWQADVEWFDDPVSGSEGTLKNIVRSTIRVEVVQAKLL